MTDVPPLQPVSRDEPPGDGEAPHAIDYAEGLLGLTFAVFLIVEWAGVVGLELLAWKTRHTDRVIVAWLGWLTILVLMSLSVRFYGGAIQRATRPVGVSVALRQRRRPLFLRPFVALWWLANAVAMVVVAHWVIGQYADFHPSTGQQVFRYAATVGVLFASAFAANTYAMIALAALAPHEPLLRIAWRFRVLVDLVTAFLIPAIGAKG